MMYILPILLGYACGCLNLAWILGKLRGFDIRNCGSHNAGASNATITMGLPFGVAVGLCDIGKALLAALAAGALFPALPYAGAVAGTAAVLGHVFPFYLRFRGGKGFASFLGVTLALDWRFFLIIVLVVLVITLVTDYIVLGTLTTVISFPIYLFLTQASYLLLVIVCVASLVIICKHFVNIRRLFTGEEIGLRRAMKKKDRVE